MFILRIKKINTQLETFLYIIEFNHYLCLHLIERQFISRTIHTSQAKTQHAPLNREHPPAQPTIRQ